MTKTGKPQLTDSLKKATSHKHAEMEAHPFIAALSKGELPLESYIGLLRAMSVIHSTLEHELNQLRFDHILPVMLDRPSRVIHLRKDLSLFDKEIVPDIEAAVTETRKIASQIRLCRVKEPEDLLAVLYILEGTTLGNSVHLDDVINNFGDKTSGKAYYYSGYGQDTAKYWLEFRNAMNGLAIDQKGHDRFVEVAQDFFSQMEALFTQLYPIENANMVYTAGMLNPEAGDHSVPENKKEIEAAVAAAKKCRDEFPYFDERYQDRGKNFAKSDAAWLASLIHLPEVELYCQVEWLGRVLANRGMPRITLESQLQLLYEELVSAVPENDERYSTLKKAAIKLKKERLAYIPESVYEELKNAFDLATDNELKGRFNRTSDLIVSAVCDQSAGISDAVNNLLPWLTDKKRFPSKWITAINNIHSLSIAYVNK